MALDDYASSCRGFQTHKADSWAVGTANSAGFDSKGYYQALFVLNAGDIDGPTGTVAVKVQQSADDVTYSDIVGAVFGTIITTDTKKTHLGRVLLNGTLRYIRTVVVTSNEAAELGLSVILEPYLGSAPSAAQFEFTV